MRWCVLAIALLGCEQPGYPGQSIGSFHVVGALESNACGAAVPALDRIEFDVELRAESGAGYWRRVDAPIVTGTYDDEESAFEFRSTIQIPVIAPEPDLMVRGCTLEQREEVRGIVEWAVPPDAGAPDPDAGDQPQALEAESLAGLSTIAFSPTPGSDCTATTAPAGGPFAALPCLVEYDLDGTPRDAF